MNDKKYYIHGNKFEEKPMPKVKQIEEKTNNKQIKWVCSMCDVIRNEYYIVIDKDDMAKDKITAKGILCYECEKTMIKLNDNWLLISPQSDIYIPTFHAITQLVKSIRMTNQFDSKTVKYESYDNKIKYDDEGRRIWI